MSPLFASTISYECLDPIKMMPISRTSKENSTCGKKKEFYIENKHHSKVLYGQIRKIKQVITKWEVSYSWRNFGWLNISSYKKKNAVQFGEYRTNLKPIQLTQSWQVWRACVCYWQKFGITIILKILKNYWPFWKRSCYIQKKNKLSIGLHSLKSISV